MVPTPAAVITPRKMSRSKNEKVNGVSNGAKPKVEIERRGISASPGIVIGTAFVRDSDRISVPRTVVDAGRVEHEVERFARSLAETSRDLRALKQDIAGKMGDDHARPGNSTAHATIFFVDHSVGSVDASDTPELAPRKCGQSFPDPGPSHRGPPARSIPGAP